MYLALKDYQKILEIIDLIYSIPDRRSMFLAVCKEFEKLIGFTSAVLLPLDSKTKSFQWPGPVSYNCDPSLAFKWAMYFAPTDPLINQWDGSINNFAQNSEVLSAPLLADSEFGRDFLYPAHIFHVIGAHLGSQGDAVSGIGFHRQKGDRPFGVREKKIAGMLLPHISRAMHNIDLMDTIVSSLETGMIIIGNDGHVSHINAEAKDILDGIPVSTIPDPGFDTSSTFFRCKKGSYNVKSIKTKVRRKEKIILLEPLPSEHCIRTRLSGFNLTCAQENVALLTVRGLSNREIGGKLFISEQTVRDHLHDVFGKLRVKRRSELTAKVMGFAL